MKYCANDTRATYEVFKKLLENYLKRYNSLR